MKVSRIFAGALIILLGLALFLSNFDVLSLDWHFIFRLWPVLLVLAGISVMVSDSKWKAALYAVTAVLVLVWIFSVASVGWGNFRGIFHNNDSAVKYQDFSQDLEKDVRYGTLSLSSGAGSFLLSEPTDEFLEAHSESNIGEYSMNSEKEGNTEKVALSFEDNKDNHWRFGGTTNKVDFKLNPRIQWDLNVNVGAASTDFDLSSFVVRTVDVKAGASSLKFKLGDKSDTTNVTINTGASTVAIYIPQSSGCQIRDGAKLSSKSFSDFVKLGDEIYKTPNFESSKKKIFVDLEAGVSSIKIKRY